MDNKDTGLLLQKNNIKLYRTYFKQMTKLLGIKVMYRAPREGKTYDLHGELDTFYYDPVLVDVIFEEHPKQSTCKKMGWNSEVTEGNTLMVVPYDLPHIQVGALFTIPSAFDDTKGRMFRVVKMQVVPVYPSEITCELQPVVSSTSTMTESRDFSKSDFNTMIMEQDDD